MGPNEKYLCSSYPSGCGFFITSLVITILFSLSSGDCQVAVYSVVILVCLWKEFNSGPTYFTILTKLPSYFQMHLFPTWVKSCTPDTFYFFFLGFYLSRNWALFDLICLTALQTKKPSGVCLLSALGPYTFPDLPSTLLHSCSCPYQLLWA